MIDEIPGLVEALSGEMTPKFLGTRTAHGMPNVVPCTTLMQAPDSGSGDVADRLIFGNFLMRKSAANLDADPRVGILVITTDLDGWVLQGDFTGWQRAGAYVDRLNSTDLLRYNPYTGIRAAGIVDVRRVVRTFSIPKLRVATDFALARLAGSGFSLPGGAVIMPRVVRRHFSPLMAVRVLAFLDREGYPLIAPVLSLQPAGERALACAHGVAGEMLAPLEVGTLVAANLLTLDVVSFQAHGRWLGSRRVPGTQVGAMSVEALFAGGPPVPGRQIA
ncbi:MAG: pyridoxamine 5'-phosphate oxidase family protein [Anaerolineae bacterium]|nr:pyridoxamine 5'-phosphate oxidase family protein [Anaerolineae bacterium]